LWLAAAAAACCVRSPDLWLACSGSLGGRLALGGGWRGGACVRRVAGAGRGDRPGLAGAVIR
jgi:hypothetical protein